MSYLYHYIKPKKVPLKTSVICLTPLFVLKILLFLRGSSREVFRKHL